MVLKAVYGEALLTFAMEAAFRDGNIMERTDAHWKGIQENWGWGEYIRRTVKFHHTDLLEIILEDWITR